MNEAQSTATPGQTTELVRWDVPFADARDPSVSLLTEQGGDVATLVVAPSGIDRYPKFLVRIERVIAVLSYEEAHAFDRGYHELTRTEDHLCAYRWIGSPWVLSYERGADLFGWASLQHYLVFGGDSIVEVVTAGEPTVQQIDSPQLIRMEHQI